MTIRIAAPGAEDNGNGTFRRPATDEAVFDPEVISQDGIYCPFCGLLQGWDTAIPLRWNRCTRCKEIFWCERVVTIEYRSGGRKRTARPSDN